jgi:hypothetical protein
VLAGGTWSSQVEDHLARPGFSDLDRQQMRELFTRAGDEGLPMETLVLRLGEGVAKHVTPEVLHEALEADVDSYLATRELIRKELGPAEADRLLEISTVWDRTVTLRKQGVDTASLASLLRMFSRQNDQARWNNYRYGGGLFLALTQWGLAGQQALAVLDALSRSSIPGEEYRQVIDVFSSGIANRIPADEMARRIAQFAPKSRSVNALERMVR